MGLRNKKLLGRLGDRALPDPRINRGSRKLPRDIRYVDGVAWTICKKCDTYAPHGKNSSRKDAIEKACKECESIRKSHQYARKRKRQRNQTRFAVSVTGSLDRGSAIEAGFILGEILKGALEDEKI